MFKNFLKVAFRNIWKSRMSAFINLVGMSIAIGCCIITFLFIDQSLNLDTFHKNLDRIHLVGNVIERNGVQTFWGDSPMPLGQKIREYCPSVEKVARVRRDVSVLKKNDYIYSEWVKYVEKDFFDIFSFPLVDGDVNSFDEPNSVYLTEEIAKKYFGTDRAVGQEITLMPSAEITEVFVVKGVFKDFPENSSILFGVLLPWQLQTKWELREPDNWKHWTESTIILMKEGHKAEDILPQLAEPLAEQQEVNGDWAISRFVVPSVKELSRSNTEYRNVIVRGTPQSATFGTVLLSAILILLAGFNYANNRIVSLSRRYREIGIRKVVGSSKGQLILQFFGENVLFVLLALLVGILIAKFVLIPGWSLIFSEHLREITFSLGNRTFAFLLLLLLVTSLGAGAYPAFIVSRFMPVDVFKGHSSNKGQNVFIRIMIGFQFSLTLLALVFPIGMYMNARYQMNMDWGYEKDGVLSIPMSTSQEADLLREQLEGYPSIIQMAKASEHIGRYSAVTAVVVDEQRYETTTFSSNPGYLELMGIPLEYGRSFGLEEREDQKTEIIVNEMFMKEVGWVDDPQGKIISIGENKYTVVGVVKNFHNMDFQAKIEPTIFRIGKPEHNTMLIVRAEKGSLVKTRDYIEEKYRELFPESPFHCVFQDEVFDQVFRLNKSILALFVFSGATSLLIAIMGLFGLVAATLSKKEKEIGVRKVLGATVSQIVQLISTPIMVILMVGAVVAILPGWYLMNVFMSELYEYHIAINAVPFLLAASVLIFVALAMLIAQTIRSALSNPVDVLRNE